MIKLYDLRHERSCTMKELGRILGVSESTISLYESGKREPDLNTIVRMCDYFGVSVDYLLGRTSVREPAGSPLPHVGYDISADEYALIRSYRQASPDDKAIIENIASRYSPSEEKRKAM